MKTKTARGVIPPAPIIFALIACAASLVATGGARAASTAQASVPVTVQGFLPGYSDNGLAQLVSACVTAAPVPGTMANGLHTGWQVQVHIQDEYMPHATTVVRVSLLDGVRVTAFRWTRTAGLDTAPRAVFCRTVCDLTTQVWDAILSSGVAPGPRHLS